MTVCGRCGREPDPDQAAMAALLEKGARARTGKPVDALCASCAGLKGKGVAAPVEREPGCEG